MTGIKIQFDVDPCIHGGDPLDQKMWTDRWTAFQLYILDLSKNFLKNRLHFLLHQFSVIVNHYLIVVRINLVLYGLCKNVFFVTTL